MNSLITLLTLVLSASCAQRAAAADTSGDTPLANKRFIWPNLPYQADTGSGPRGTQQGYNTCNATTQNQQSMCQTSFLNSIDEFCLWGSPQPNQTVANVEESMVAFCTKKKFGARLLTAGALQGVQLIRTPGYVEIVGFIDQTTLNLTPDDSGGEEDPHGADQRGNPLGSLVYSNAFNTSGGPAYTQVIEWTYFVGGGSFCFKACDPAGPNAAELCQHVYDRVGCLYNAPANYPSINGTFQSCKGENQLPVGNYVEGGVTKVWTQPAESLGPISTIPYTPAIPATSDCTTYTSAALYTELPSPPSPAAATATGNTSNKGSSTVGANGLPEKTGAGLAAKSSSSTHYEVLSGAVGWISVAIVSISSFALLL